MDDAPVTMTPLHGEVKLPKFVVLLIFSQIEIHTLRDQPVNNLSTPADRESDGRFVTQACASAQRVVDVRLH